MQARDRQRKREAKKAKRSLAHKASVKARNAAKLGVKKGPARHRAAQPDLQSRGYPLPTASVNRSQVVQNPDGTTDVQIAQSYTSEADSAKTISELKALAKQYGVKGYSKYKKADIEALRDLVREAMAQ